MTDAHMTGVRMTDVRMTDAHMTGAELRSLLADCLALWSVRARLEPLADGVAIHAPEGCYVIRPAPVELRPVRWFVQTPERARAGRPPRATPSIVAALSALRNALGAEGGSRLRVGG